MKKEFPGYFSGATADIEKLWNECVFVLDANVLLNLYRYSDFTCSKLLEVFSSLSDRLWVPHQVVYEYLTNRLTVISDQGKLYEDAVKKVDSLRKNLESHNQHPFISPGTLADSLNLFDRITSELSQNKLAYEKRINADEIKDRLEKLLEDKVGSAFSREQLDKIIVDGKGRYEQKTPPGYCDVKKGGDSIIFSDICRPYGDYIVWLQIIEHAKSVNKSVVFITGDTKDDWWASFQGKTLGPHPQLVQEFLLLVEKDFYMYLPDRFLEKASTYLKQDGSEQAVNEIRDVRKEDLESALLDKAFNFAWPEAVSSKAWNGRDVKNAWLGKSVGLGWSEGELARQSEFHYMAQQRVEARERLEQARMRLDQLHAERESLIEARRNLLVAGNVPGDEVLNECESRLSVVGHMLDVHKNEFAVLRAHLRAVVARYRELEGGLDE